MTVSPYNLSSKGSSWPISIHFLYIAKTSAPVIKIRMGMRIVVPTTVKVVEASCNRKLQEVFYHPYFQCYLRIILIPIFHVFGHCQETHFHVLFSIP